MLRIETPGGMMWSCLDCGYVAKKANVIEHIDAKGVHNFMVLIGVLIIVGCLIF